jgi:hypothetical protein
MQSTKKTLTEQIRETVKALPKDTAIFLKEYLHLGSRSAVSNAFSKLVEEETLSRIARGLYAILTPYSVPSIGHHGKVLPPTWEFLSSISEKTGEIFVEQSANAANALGLTTQVPGKAVYFVSGTSRILTFKKCKVILYHAPSWKLLFPHSMSGGLLRSLDWAYPEWIEKSIPILKKNVPIEEWVKLYTAKEQLPKWMSKIVRNVIESAKL